MHCLCAMLFRRDCSIASYSILKQVGQRTDAMYLRQGNIGRTIGVVKSLVASNSVSSQGNDHRRGGLSK
jgi:hypothetical protein